MLCTCWWLAAVTLNVIKLFLVFIGCNTSPVPPSAVVISGWWRFPGVGMRRLDGALAKTTSNGHYFCPVLLIQNRNEPSSARSLRLRWQPQSSQAEEVVAGCRDALPNTWNSSLNKTPRTFGTTNTNWTTCSRSTQQSQGETRPGTTSTFQTKKQQQQKKKTRDNKDKMHITLFFGTFLQCNLRLRWRLSKRVKASLLYLCLNVMGRRLRSFCICIRLHKLFHQLVKSIMSQWEVVSKNKAYSSYSHPFSLPLIHLNTKFRAFDPWRELSDQISSDVALWLSSDTFLQWVSSSAPRPAHRLVSGCSSKFNTR